jgi:hypothetical protein
LDHKTVKIGEGFGIKKPGSHLRFSRQLGQGLAPTLKDEMDWLGCPIPLAFRLGSEPIIQERVGWVKAPGPSGQSHVKKAVVFVSVDP